MVTIINLGLAFEEEKVLAGDESRIFIFKNNSELSEVADSDVEIETAPDNIGIHVDRISDVIRVENEELQAVPSNMAHPFYKHVVRREDSFTISWSLPRFLTYTKIRTFYHERAKGHQVQHLQPHHHLRAPGGLRYDRESPAGDFSDLQPGQVQGAGGK